jgi:hypothetical protein
MIEIKETSTSDIYRIIIAKENDDTETYGIKLKKKELYELYLKLQELFREI